MSGYDLSPGTENGYGCGCVAFWSVRAMIAPCWLQGRRRYPVGVLERGCATGKPFAHVVECVALPSGESAGAWG